MDYRENAVDRISELPPFIIHHIMSYLSTEEVARTSILSKRWNQLRTSFPILDFDQRYFTSRTVFHTNFCVRRKNEKFCQGVKRFINFVDTSLHRFCDLKLSIQKFRLFISLLDVKESSSNVDKWIGLVVENGVKELDFDVISDKDTVYTLPRTLFSAELLTTLKLVGCRLEQPFDTTSFRSLKKLTLERVCLNEQMVQKLTSECLVLEDLCFSLCWGLKRLSVSKALKLKKLKFHSASDEPGIVEIVVPSLQQLILQFSRVTKPRIVDIARSPHLKKCELFDVLFTDQEFNNLISKFPMLEALSVRCCDAIERIAISNDQLRDLHFFCCNSLKAVDADTPNLLSFTYDKNPIPHISLNAACPWRVSIESKGGLNTRWLLKAKEFLSVSSDIEILELIMKSDETSFNLDELRENSPSFPFQVGNLHLLMDVPPSDYEILLDGVFWICYPKTLSLHNWDENDYKFIQWFYDQLQNRNVTCCNSRHVKCWRHYLKNTKIESFKQGYKVIDIDNLMEGWPMLPSGCLQIGFDWGFPVLADK